MPAIALASARWWIASLCPLAMTWMSSSLLAAECPAAAPNAPRHPRRCTSDARACPTATALSRTRRAAARWRAGSAAAQNRRRSSGRHCAACSPRNPRRTCIRRNRSARPSAFGGRSLSQYSQFGRSCSAMVVSWVDLTADDRKSYREMRMTDFPRFRRHAQDLSGNLALSFSRSSTIDERTCATLWCGISTLLTRSERSLRSRSTTFST